VIVLGKKGNKRNLGKGQFPIIKAIDDDHILCVWENEKRIDKTVLEF
jgi:hypothetical protein